MTPGRAYFLALLLAACASRRASPRRHVAAPESRAADRDMLLIPAGPYRRGSTAAERQQAYDDYLRTSGRDSARENSWFQHEPEASRARLPNFKIDRHPVTQAAFAEFVQATGSPAPRIDRAQWDAQGFIQDYESEVRRYNWNERRPPRGREQHPVVLVPWKQARDYCQWRAELVGEPRRLPSADEFEKAARGPGGSIYPWGEDYDPDKLNSADAGPRDTMPVGSYPQGRSQAGAEGMAGNVFHWTRTPWPHGANRMTVKGSAWDDHGGLGRAAAAHGRRRNIRHVIVGFRCASGPDL